LALNVLGSARKGMGRAWGWITASSTHLLIVALVASLAFGLWERHGKHAAQVRLSACESGRKADRASYAAAQQEALRRAAGGRRQRRKLITRNSQMKPTGKRLLLLSMPMLALLSMSALTGCATKPLLVRPADPLPAPAVAVPKVLTDPVQKPSWLQ
jgi:hypothetical protein